MTAQACRRVSKQPIARDWEWELFGLLSNKSAVNCGLVEAIGTKGRDLRCCSRSAYTKRPQIVSEGRNGQPETLTSCGCQFSAPPASAKDETEEGHGGC